MTSNISSLGDFTLSASVTGTATTDAAESGVAGGASTAASGDVVDFSEEGLRLAATGIQKQDEDSDESAAASKIKDKMKDIQKLIRELQEQIREIEEQNLSDEQKRQKIQMLQSQISQYQSQLADLQKSLTGSGGNPGGTRAEGASMSLT